MMNLKNKKMEGLTEFSKKKTLQEQREYLPIYSVREELMQVINDHKIVIIVGETGCGQTQSYLNYR